MFEKPHFCNNHYDALSLYVTGLNMVLEEGGNPKDGKSLVQKLLSRSYHSAMGYRSQFKTTLVEFSAPTCQNSNHLSYYWKVSISTGFSWTSMGMLKEITPLYPPSH